MLGPTLPPRRCYTFRDGTTAEVHLPLVYPASYRAEGEFALGSETDHVCPDNGPTRCIGGNCYPLHILERYLLTNEVR